MGRNSYRKNDVDIKVFVKEYHEKYARVSDLKSFSQTRRNADKAITSSHPAKVPWGHTRNMLVLKTRVLPYVRILCTFSALLSISTAFETTIPFSATSHHSHGTLLLGTKARCPSICHRDMRCVSSNFESGHGDSRRSNLPFTSRVSMGMYESACMSMKTAPRKKWGEHACKRPGDKIKTMMCAREGEIQTKKESKKKARDMSVVELRDALLAEVGPVVVRHGYACVCCMHVSWNCVMLFLLRWDLL